MQSPLPQRLKSARKLAKLTQEKLSNKLGFDDRSHGTARISQYETGKHAPDFA
ncbi:MAG: helix-turn-helix domain-containing protein, partial [Gammaproteobacteria bacterium]|nr:helix-turn-helix domain-containing protein [Gammaproteobacteria bacterium]